MDISLTQALAPVLRDLESSGLVVPVARDDDWSDVDGQLTATLCVPGGYGFGVFVMAGEPVPEQIASVADQVHEWAAEELWTLGRPTNWPMCPEHPHTHPLAARVRGGDAVWVCPKTEGVVSGIGRLPASRSPGRPVARLRPAPRSAVAPRSAAAVRSWPPGQDPDAGRHD